MKINKLKQLLFANWHLIFSVFLGAWVIIPLLNPGFFSMHDNEQVARLFDLDQALKAGQFPVRILPNLGFGYGYPLFNFYPPFVYYFAEIFKLAGFGYIDSIKIMIGVGFLLSFVFMFLLVKEFFGKMAGSIAGLSYLFAPYHSVDVYVRGALPEFWSFVFIPAIFWSLKKLQSTNNLVYIILSSIFGAGLVISHNLIAIMVIPFLSFYAGFLIFESKNRLKLLKHMILSALIGISLSAFFWLPSLVEKKHTAVDILTIELANYSQHFVCARQFIFSKWGYSGSVPGCFDGLSFGLGLPQIVLLGIFLILLAINIKRIKEYKIQLLFLFLFLFSLFVQTIHSKFIWDKINALAYIQFPWRFLVLSSFTMSFLVGSIFVFKNKLKIKYAIFLIGTLCIFWFNKDFFKPERQFLNATDHAYTDNEYIRWDISNLAAEYVPSGVAMKKTIFGNTAIDIDKSKIAKSPYKVLSGEMQVNTLINKPHVKEFSVGVKRSGVFQAQTFSFPGWELFIDGNKTRYSDNNKYKLISAKLTEGEHNLKLVFVDTPLRKLANLISAVGLIALVTLVFVANPLKYPLKARKND